MRHPGFDQTFLVSRDYVMKRAFTLLLALSLTGCQTVQPISMPTSAPAIGPPKIAINPAIPTKDDKWGGNDIEGTYFANAGARGSLLVGLFIPLGVLFNQAYVGSKNAERAESLQDLTRLNLRELLMDSYPDLSGEAADADYLIQPYVVLFQQNDEDIRTWCHITAKRRSFGEGAWKSVYRFTADAIYKKSSNLPSPQQLAECLRVSYDLFIEHIEGQLEPFQAASVKLNDISLNLEVSKKKGLRDTDHLTT